jgi:ATP-binding cassette subfamily C protein CydD
MGTAYHARMEALGAAERLAALELGWSTTNSAATGAKDARFEQVSVHLQNVSLSYGEGRTALADITLDIPAGQCVAFVGISGAGKSSLFNLIMGFSTPSRGRVLVNGMPLAEITPQSWREHIAYVPQRPVLLEASVTDNIAMGEAAPDAAMVHAAARKAGIAARIEALPQGYDTVIGDGGLGLSGGEAHRLALARALYRDAPLLLLDEPTAHLDARNAAGVREAIAAAAMGRTVLMIVHGGELLALADSIVTLEAGRITRIERRSVEQTPEGTP